jgi:hypothetical protein
VSYECSEDGHARAEKDVDDLGSLGFGAQGLGVPGLFGLEGRGGFYFQEKLPCRVLLLSVMMMMK